jgi:ureidoacrylate peracid hydrolase
MSMPESPLDIASRISHVQPLVTLEAKVQPGHAALVVVDMQNDFCAHGGLVDKGGRDVSAAQAMAARLPGLIEAARAAGVFIVFVRNVYTTESNFYLSDV